MDGYTRLGVARFTTAGMPDGTFGVGGLLTTPLHVDGEQTVAPWIPTWGQGLAVGIDDAFFLIGHERPAVGDPMHVSLERRSANGEIDGTFHPSAWALEGAVTSNGTAVSPMPDTNDVVLGGTAWYGGTDTRTVIGLIDATTGSDDTRLPPSPFENLCDVIVSTIALPDHRVLIAARNLGTSDLCIRHLHLATTGIEDVASMTLQTQHTLSTMAASQPMNNWALALDARVEVYDLNASRAIDPPPRGTITTDLHGKQAVVLEDVGPGGRVTVAGHHATPTGPIVVRRFWL